MTTSGERIDKLKSLSFGQHAFMWTSSWRDFNFNPFVHRPEEYNFGKVTTASAYFEPIWHIEENKQPAKLLSFHFEIIR